MNIQSLPPESTIIPAEMMASYEAVWNSPVPSAFVSGLSYVAGDFSIAPGQLENIPVGIQEHAIAEGEFTIIAAESQPKAPASIEQDSNFSNDNYNNSDASKIAKRINKESAKHIAIAAQKKNVSRRLLLAERSKKLTVVCPDTGIVSLIEAPAIPGFSLIYGSPFSSLANCRGIASRGSNYLRLLDTQVLAGILIILAESYDLFAFMPADTGAQKNAILRTVGKDYLIAAIIFIEDRVHSNNAKYLTKLSLRQDSVFNAEGAEIRMQAWLKVIAEEIIVPDTTEYDSNYVDKTYQIRPKYVEKKDSVSFLAKKEIAEAKKAFTEDKKQGKLLIGALLKEEIVTEKLRGLLAAFMQDDALLTFSTDHPILQAVVARLEKYENSETAQSLIKILTKNRSRLLLDVAEIEAEIASQQIEEEEEQKDDPAPGNEPSILDKIADKYVSQEEYDESPTMGIDDETMGRPKAGDSTTSSTYSSITDSFNSSSIHTAVMDYVEAHIEIAEIEEPKLEAPAGLSKIQQILWLKKIAASKTRNIVQTDMPSTVSYVPSAKKQNLGE